ncbi:hypothetical protein K474DRAFT_1677874 [Panus rudis PR-1116 ss-1]|nr:hypothetical protein K474DRAFT_1677874 [Panus rudis PR-1116 ss-1]
MWKRTLGRRGSDSLGGDEIGSGLMFLLRLKLYLSLSALYCVMLPSTLSGTEELCIRICVGFILSGHPAQADLKPDVGTPPELPVNTIDSNYNLRMLYEWTTNQMYTTPTICWAIKTPTPIKALKTATQMVPKTVCTSMCMIEVLKEH